MPVACEEYIKSPSQTGNFHESQQVKTFKVTGTEDESAAYAALISASPASVTIDGFTLSQRVFELSHDDYMVWTGTCTYTKQSLHQEELQPGESSYQFETGGGQIHGSYAYATTKYPSSAATPEVNNAINFDGDKVNGVDLQGPVYNFSESHVIPSASVTGAYKLALFRATGKTNNQIFRDFQAGEVLFLGASGSKRGDDDWEINFRFSASENVTGLTIAGVTGIAKKGWEYLWVMWEKELDTTNLYVKPKPKGVYVQKVYQEADFSTLGIGT